MARNVFSIPIFFIVFRETLEAAIIVSVLLGLVEQIVKGNSPASSLFVAPSTPTTDEKASDSAGAGVSTTTTPVVDGAVDSEAANRRLVKKLRWQIFIGSAIGLVIALAIGAAFIAVWFTQASNLWEKSEDLWEGIFSLIASIIIFIMGVTMLKMDRAKAKWRVKLQKAFDGRAVDSKTRTSKYMLLFLPLITVLREGIEAVIFVGGVSLGEPATAIPIAAIVGILCGVVCGLIIYTFASRAALSVFLVVMTNLLLLIGSGLFSKAVHDFQNHAFSKLLGADADDAAGGGPGTYDVRGYVWQLECCGSGYANAQGWSIFSALLGWTNSASLGTVLSYVFYWIAVIIVLIGMKFTEGRTTLLGRESKTGRVRRERREEKAAAEAV